MIGPAYPALLFSPSLRSAFGSCRWNVLDHPTYVVLVVKCELDAEASVFHPVVPDLLLRAGFRVAAANEERQFHGRFLSLNRRARLHYRPDGINCSPPVLWNGTAVPASGRPCNRRLQRSIRRSDFDRSRMAICQENNLPWLE